MERPADYAEYSREYIYDLACTDQQLQDLMTWARARLGTKYNFMDIVGLLVRNRSSPAGPQRLICSQFCTPGLLTVFGAAKVLNVQGDYAYLITPETLHLSPIFVGRRVSKKEM